MEHFCMPVVLYSIVIDNYHMGQKHAQSFEQVSTGL